MVYTTEKELNRSLKEGLARVYLLYGEDRYLVEQYAALIAKRALGGGDATFNFDRFDGKKPDFDALADSVLALPMLADNRCILIDDPDIDRMAAADLDRLCAVLREVGEGTVAVVAVKGDFPLKKSAKCKKLRALCDELGAVAELGARSAGDLARAVVKRLSAVGVQLPLEDARYLVERTTGEVSAVNAEADKLAAYASTGAPVTRAVIDRLVPATVEAEIFGLSKAILGRDYERGMGILENLLYLREPAVNILYTLSAAFIDLYRAKAAAFADVDAPAVAAAFGYKGREFVVKNALRDSRRLDLGFLKGALEVLLEADAQLKGSRVAEDIVLQQAVTRLFRLLEGGARMIALSQVVVVEGRYDKAKLASILDATIVETGGFRIYKDREKLKMLRMLGEKRGLVILTDSDAAGFQIRSYLRGAIPNAKIYNAYIPDILGKEKRKARPSAEGKLGVEGVPTRVILEALERAGVFAQETEAPRRRITKADFAELGLSGGPGSSARRRELLKLAGLPEHLSANGMVDILNSMLTYEEFLALAEQV